MVSRLRRMPVSPPSNNDTTTAYFESTTTFENEVAENPPRTKKAERHHRSSPRRNLFFLKRRNRSGDCMTETMQQTRVVPMISSSPPSAPPQLKQSDSRDSTQSSQHEHEWSAPLTTSTAVFCSSTTSSSFFQFCGISNTRKVIQDEEKEAARTSPSNNRYHHCYEHSMPDDPTVQESIECVIAASQGELADLLKHYDQHGPPMTPSGLQQSLLKNRTFEKRVGSSSSSSCSLRLMNTMSPPPPNSIGSKGSGCTPLAAAPPITTKEEPAVKQQQRRQECECCQTSIPQALPLAWPQRPLLLRPTPNSGTIVKGVRFVNDTEYLWTPNHDDDNDSMTTTSQNSWIGALHSKWGVATASIDYDDDTMVRQPGMILQDCPKCACLPINNGDEPTGQTLVTDFESDLFIGTLLLRIRGSRGTTHDDERLSQGYFYGLNRRYQVVIRGKFKSAISWTECFTGFQLERPAGKLPPKWIVNGALNVIKFFAPQVQTNMHGDRPYSLTPLGSTPQVLAVDQPVGMEPLQEEPKEDKQTLLGQASTAKSSMQRARQRKKHFDKLFATGTGENEKQLLVTDPNKEYTFEFLQHLFNFDDFSIELGSMIGSVSLQTILAGQALQIMASHGPPNKLDDSLSIRNRLWSFDIWHEMLLSSEQPKQ